MRLNAAQINMIKQEAEHYFGARAELWLFGSRELRNVFAVRYDHG